MSSMVLVVTSSVAWVVTSSMILVFSPSMVCVFTLLRVLFCYVINGFGVYVIDSFVICFRDLSVFAACLASSITYVIDHLVYIPSSILRCLHNISRNIARLA